MKGMIGIIVTALMILLVYFFFYSAEDETIILQDLTDSPFVVDTAYLKDKQLPVLQVDDKVHAVNSLVTKPTPKKAVSQVTVEFVAEQLSDMGMDAMGGYYDEYAIAPHEEVAQIEYRGPIGKVNPNAVPPGVEELIVSDNVVYMKTQPAEKGTGP
jgi:hypothetical protein